MLEQRKVLCAVYTRQSVERLRKGDFGSCDVQRELCESFVRAMAYEGWHLVKQRFDDVGYSGNSIDRPALQHLLQCVERGIVNQIVVQRFDRLTRNLHDWIWLNEFLKSRCTVLSIVEGSLEVAGGAFTDFVGNILATFGQFERDIILERMKDARDSRAIEGMRFAGKPPIGYRSHPGTRQLVIDESEAHLVRRFFELAANGNSTAAIARIVNEEGHRTKMHGKQGGKLWTGRTVLQVIRNPVYLGERLYKGKIFNGIHEAIVTKQLVEAAHTQISMRHSNKPKKRISFKTDPFDLRGILHCGRCGKPMTTSIFRKRRKSNHKVSTYRYYRCRGSAESPACIPPVQVPAHIVEDEVQRLLKNPWQNVQGAHDSKRLLISNFEELANVCSRRKLQFIRELVWSASWDPKKRQVHLILDEINLERLCQ